MGFLTDDDREKLTPSELLPYDTPIPTQVVSSDEFYPFPQTEKQRELQARLLDLADGLAKKQGVSRRRFFQTAAGMAASYVAMNETFGNFFDVTHAEAATPAMADERADSLKDQFIMDMHTHFLRDDTRIKNFVAMRAAVGKAGWNKDLAGKEQTIDDLKYDNYVKEVFLDSDTKIVLISSAPSDIEQDWFLTNEQMAASARQGEPALRLAAAVRARDFHARPAGLAGEGRCRAGAEAGIDEGLYDRRQYPQGYEPLSLAHGRREGRLSRL